MRTVLVAGLLLGLAVPVWAGGKKVDCDAQAAMVMDVVQARVDGEPKRKVRKSLKKDMGKEAAEMLADWIYALEEEQLTDQVGVVWKAQCEAL